MKNNNKKTTYGLMEPKKRYSSQNYLGFTIIALILAIAFAWFLELVMKLEPCSLCLLQRWGIYSSFVFLIPAWIIGQFKKTTILKWIKVALLTIGMMCLGFSVGAALRQTYIQLMPAGMIPSCGADLQTLLSIVTPLQAIGQVFQGSGECSEKAWVFLGLSLAMWAAILFCILFITLFISWIKEIKNNPNRKVLY